jgi:predicted CXXCH cytochrome family protein
MVDRNVDAGNTVFNPNSHGFDPDKMPGNQDIKANGLPFTPGSMVTCLTCHDSHMPKNRPFLAVPFTGICERCHKGWENTGFGVLNSTGSHPVQVEPFDNTGGPSPIEVGGEFAVPFPDPYPTEKGSLSSTGHWTLGGHLTYGSHGRVECSTCHAFHGVEETGPFPDLLSKDPVKTVSNEFCEGCHQGERGDGNEEPPYPNPGGTITGRTYHPVDDDEANGIGWITAIADTIQRSPYEWGEIDAETELPVLICTTCHVAHNGMENSPSLVPIADTTSADGVETFCEICHRDPPVGHHGYEGGGFLRPSIVDQLLESQVRMGITYGEILPDKIYCSHCHRAHNAGYGREEENFIPILVESSLGELCDICHGLGVSHFMGDPTLPSTYGKLDPSLKRDPWPWGGYSIYEEGGAEGVADEGEEELPTTITCQSCHDLSDPPEGQEVISYRLLAPAGEHIDWYEDYPEEYLCTGCHGNSPTTIGGGLTHPLMNADSSLYATIKTSHLLSNEHPVTYTENGAVNCHSCHKAHNAALAGGVYILKVGRGDNIDPKAIRPKLEYSDLCDSCHPYK